MTKIFPDKRFLDRKNKEELLNQRSCVLWLTGLSGSGKSTIARELELRLHGIGKLTVVLDGDNIRSGLNQNLGFAPDDRLENIRRISEVAKLFVQNGVITICCFISPTREIRGISRTISGDRDFIEIFVDAPLEVCENRDVKGLYKDARAGNIKGFTGIDAPYEIPENPDLVLKTEKMSVEACVDIVLNFLHDKIQL